jgi:hypothetical protein
MSRATQPRNGFQVGVHLLENLTSYFKYAHFFPWLRCIFLLPILTAVEQITTWLMTPLQIEATIERLQYQYELEVAEGGEPAGANMTQKGIRNWNKVLATYRDSIITSSSSLETAIDDMVENVGVAADKGGLAEYISIFNRDMDNADTFEAFLVESFRRLYYLRRFAKGETPGSDDSVQTRTTEKPKKPSKKELKQKEKEESVDRRLFSIEQVNDEDWLNLESRQLASQTKLLSESIENPFEYVQVVMYKDHAKRIASKLDLVAHKNCQGGDVFGLGTMCDTIKSMQHKTRVVSDLLGFCEMDTGLDVVERFCAAGSSGSHKISALDGFFDNERYVTFSGKPRNSSDASQTTNVCADVSFRREFYDAFLRYWTGKRAFSKCGIWFIERKFVWRRIFSLFEYIAPSPPAPERATAHEPHLASPPRR